MTGVSISHWSDVWDYPLEIHFSFPVAEELKQLVYDLKIRSEVNVNDSTYALFFKNRKDQDIFCERAEELGVRVV